MYRLVWTLKSRFPSDLAGGQATVPRRRREKMLHAAGNAPIGRISVDILDVFD